MRLKTGRRSLFVLGLGVLAASLSGLTLSARAWADEAQLRFRLTTDPATLDWNLAHTSHETYIVMNLMEGLVEEGPDQKPRPALAESWDVSADGRTYTFELRKDVKWSDGRALKAADFEDSWFRLIDPKLKAPYAAFLFEVENAEAFAQGKLKDRSAVGIKALGTSKFQVKLRKRVPYFLHLATFWVTFPVRMDQIRKYPRDWATPGKIVTLGPYRLASWEKGKAVRLSKNPDYFATSSAFSAAPDSIEAVIEPDDAKARRLFDGGKLDVLLNATTHDLLRVQKPGGVAGVRIAQYPYLATYYLGFNVNAGPLRNKEVRHAIAAAIRKEAIPAVLQGGETVARSWLPPGIESQAQPEQVSGSLYDARAALSKAGYVEGNGFPKLTLYVEKFDGAEALSKHLTRALREGLGISVETKFGRPSALKGASDAAIFVAHWGADFPDPENFFSVFARESGTNYTGWRNPEYDALLEKARSSSDSGERFAAYAEAERLLVSRESVIVPLFYKKSTVLLRSRVKTFTISPLNYLFLKTVSVSGS